MALSFSPDYVAKSRSRGQMLAMGADTEGVVGGETLPTSQTTAGYHCRFGSYEDIAFIQALTAVETYRQLV